MTSTYFIRHTNNPEADIERGFSFVGYQLFSSREAALETVAENVGAADMEDFDLEKWLDNNDRLVGQDNITGLWGQRRSGLCAFAEFETLTEAQIALETGDYGDAAGGDAATFAVIYEGFRTFDSELDGGDEGLSFAPIAVAFKKSL